MSRPSAGRTEQRAAEAPDHLQRGQHQRQPQQRQRLAAHRQRRDAQRDVDVLGHPAGADEDQPIHQLRELVGELHRHAAAERVADDGDPFDVEHAEQIAHAVGVRGHRVVGARLVGLAVAQQIGRDHGEPLRELATARCSTSWSCRRCRGSAGSPGPEPAIRNARRYPWMVRNCSVGVTSRTVRRLGFRSRHRSPTSSSGPWSGGQVKTAVSPSPPVELVSGLLGEESLELGAEFVAAGQILVTRQQATGSPERQRTHRTVAPAPSPLERPRRWTRPAR